MLSRVLALVTALAIAPSTAAAQEERGVRAEGAGGPRITTEDPHGTGRLQEARESFARGLELSDQGRWGEALTYFQRSRELVPRPSSTYNIAVALYHVGRPVDALRYFEEYLATDDARREAHRAAEAHRYLQLMRASIGTVVVEVTPPEAQVRVDGRPIAGYGRVRELKVDPGVRALHLEAHGHEAFDTEVEVEGGERIEVSVALEPIEDALGPAERVDDDRGGGLFTEPLFWVVAVAAIAAAVGTAIFLTTGDDPYDGSTGVVIRALGAP